MRCFIHNEAEAIATCVRCGKAMCAKCSAYNNHNGICPECRRLEFIEEVKQNENKIKLYKSDATANIVYTCLLFWTIIAIPITLYNYFDYKKKAEELIARNEKLNEEIARLETALNERGTNAFI